MKLSPEAFNILEELSSPGAHRAAYLTPRNVRLLATLSRVDPERHAAIMVKLTGWAQLSDLKAAVKRWLAEADDIRARSKTEKKVQEAASSGRPVIERGAPRDTAERFRAERHQHLYFAEGEWLEYEVNCYQPREELHVRSLLSAFMAEGVDSETGEDFKPGKRDVDEAMDALRSLAFRNDLSPPTWIDYWPGIDPDPKKVIVVRNGLLDLTNGYLYSSTPRFFTRNGLTYAYDPDAPEPEREAIANLARTCSSLGQERYQGQVNFHRRLVQAFSGGHPGPLNQKAEAWWDLSLNQLGDALKQSFKLPTNPMKNPRLADEWEPYLQEKRNENARLTRALANAEVELNDRVYRLFNLTAEEVKLLQQEVEH